MPIRKGTARERVDLFGGSGTVLVWDLLEGKARGPFKGVVSCELEPAGSVGRHVEERYAELVIGVEGTGEVRVGGKANALMAGDVVYLPRGEVMEILNLSGDVPLQYLILKVPAEAGKPARDTIGKDQTSPE